MDQWYFLNLLHISIPTKWCGGVIKIKLNIFKNFWWSPSSLSDEVLRLDWWDQLNNSNQQLSNASLFSNSKGFGTFKLDPCRLVILFIATLWRINTWPHKTGKKREQDYFSRLQTRSVNLHLVNSQDLINNSALPLFFPQNWPPLNSHFVQESDEKFLKFARLGWLADNPICPKRLVYWGPK